MKPNRGLMHLAVILLGLSLMLIPVAGLAGCGESEEESAGGTSEPIKVGVVTPLSGAGAVLGQGTLAAVEVWAKQVNEAGGILGREVELLVQDDATDPKTANEKAKAVVGEGAEVVCGPIYDTERTAVKQAVCGAGKILVYGTYYEGGDYDDLMFITGSVPDQAVDTFVPWLISEYGDTFYFVGSDYSYPRVVNGMAREILEAQGGQSLGEEYAALGTTDFASTLTRIAKAGPKVVFGNVVGTDAIAFAKQYYDYGLPDKMQLYECFDQSFVEGVGVEQMEGVAVCQGYFEGIDTPANKAFLEEWYAADPGLPPVDISVKTYVGLQLWAAAVEKAGTTDAQEVRGAMEGLTLTDTPAGEVTMRAHDHHLIQHMYIAVCRDGTFEIVEDLGLLEPGEDQRASSE